MTTPDPAHVLTLHRYYTWSTMLKANFETALADATASGQPFTLNSDDGFRAFGYMSYWYASLWVAVEGWQKLGLRDKKVDELIASETESA